jgi:signal transduction histidine kinase
MSTRWRWDRRTRMLLTMELAVVLPAAALIGYSVWSLNSIQRDKSVEAAIQRDFSEVLKIAEKHINERATKATLAVRDEFPCPDEDPVVETLDKILERHPEIAHAFLYDQNTGFTLRSQPRRMEDKDFRKEAADFANMVQWIKMDAPGMVPKLHKSEEKEGYAIYSFGNLVPRGERQLYQAVALFTLPKVPSSRIAMGGVAADADYLRDQFFPRLMVNLLSDPQSGKNTANQAVMMLHLRRESEALATTPGWDGGKPEVERNLEGMFPGLTLAIKYRGTTIAALSHKFLLTNALIVGGLSIFLGAGIWLTYRSVSKEMALAKLKSDFVANVSHELRTPLSLIRLYAETLEMGRLTSPEKYEEYFRTIRKESERLSALINNILDFSRIEAGKKEYDFRETNLAELVRTTLEAYRYQIEQNGFEFQENIEDNLPPVRVDREAIARSLLNLVNNALKYSPNEKFIGVKLHRANGSVQLEVVDHGIGIPRSEQPKIFEKFYRVGDPLVHNTKGSGLGLSLVRHIVRAHGGDVRVESAPGKGSKFVIALPLAPGPRPEEAA